MASRQPGCSAARFLLSRPRSMRVQKRPMRAKSASAGAICLTRFRITVQKTAKLLHIFESAGCAAFAMCFTRLRNILSPMNSLTPPEKIRANICWRCLGRIVRFRRKNWQKIIRTTTAITRSIRLIRRGSVAWWKLRPKKRVGAKRKTETDLEWAWPCTEVF